MKILSSLGFVFLSIFCFSQNNSPVPNKDDTKFNISFNYGFSKRIGKNPSGISGEQLNYIKDLKSGSAFNIKLSYQKDEKTILGIVYTQFSSNGQLKNQSFIEPNGNSSSGTVSDDITISFIGFGGGLFEKGLRDDDSVILEMYLGYISYKNDFVLNNNYTIKGGNLGISADFSYYFGITKNFKIGPSIAFNGGVIKKFNLEGSNGYNESIKLEDDSFESLYRFDFMIGTLIRL